SVTAIRRSAMPPTLSSNRPNGCGCGRATMRPEEFALDQLFWGLHDAVVVAPTAEGRIVLWNPAAARLFGYSEAVAQQLTVDQLVPHELRGQHRAGVARYHSTGAGKLVGSDLPIVLPARHQSGREITVELTLTSVRAAGIERRFVLALLRDITALKHSEA